MKDYRLALGLTWWAAAALPMLASMPAAVRAQALWTPPTGPAAQEEKPPPAFDRDAGERRRLTAPLPGTAVPRVTMWYTPKAPAYYVRQGRVLEAPAGSALAAYPATRVTASITAKPPQTALEEFGKAAGVTIRGRDAYFLRDPGLPPVTLQTKDAPLLEGLLELCSQTGTTPSEMIPKRVTLSPTEAQSGVGTWCVCGPFAVVLQRIENVADLAMAPGGTGNISGSSGSNLPVGPQGARMSVLLLAEPGVAVASFPSMLEIETFVDDADQKIQASGENRASFGVTRTSVATLRQLTLPLAMPQRPGHKIILLKGTASPLVSKKVEHVEESPPLQTVTRMAGGMSVEIFPLTKQGTSNYALKVRLSKGELDVESWAKARRAADDLSLVVEDLGGQPLRSFPQQAQHEGDDSVLLSATMYSTTNAVPGKIVLDIPGPLQEVRVPFEFQNLVLP